MIKLPTFKFFKRIPSSRSSPRPVVVKMAPPSLRPRGVMHVGTVMEFKRP